MSMESSFIGMKIGRRLDQFIEQSQLGYVFGPGPHCYLVTFFGKMLC